MIVGFTGTRNGMTPEQRGRVGRMLSRWQLGDTLLGIHGDCVGADADFDAICCELGIVRWCRPCTLKGEVVHPFRAKTGAVQIALPTNPMARNRRIAEQCDVMIGCPPNDFELWRGSGTWATIRCGVRYGKRVHVVYPDGSVEARHRGQFIWGLCPPDLWEYGGTAFFTVKHEAVSYARHMGHAWEVWRMRTNRHNAACWADAELVDVVGG